MTEDKITSFRSLNLKSNACYIRGNKLCLSVIETNFLVCLPSAPVCAFSQLLQNVQNNQRTSKTDRIKSCFRKPAFIPILSINDQLFLPKGVLSFETEPAPLFVLRSIWRLSEPPQRRVSRGLLIKLEVAITACWWVHSAMHKRVCTIPSNWSRVNYCSV